MIFNVRLTGAGDNVQGQHTHTYISVGFSQTHPSVMPFEKQLFLLVLSFLVKRSATQFGQIFKFA